MPGTRPGMRRSDAAPGGAGTERDMSFVGRSVPRLEDRPLLRRPGPLRGRRVVSADAAHARSCARRGAWPHRVDRRERGAGAAGRGGGVDRRRCRRHSADRFPADQARRAGALPPADPRATDACAMSAIRSRRCLRPIPISPRTPPTSSRSISRNCRSCSTPTAPPGEFDDRPLDRAGRDPQRLRRRRRPPSRRRMRSSSSSSSVGRHSGVPMETRGAIARYDAARDVLEMHGAAKVPHWNRDQHRPHARPRCRRRVHLYEGHVGGGFGIRGELYPEDVLVCVAALRLGRPVKWIEDRREHLIAANHSRQQLHRVRAAVDARRPHPRHRRRVLPRPGRLCAHPRGDRARSRGGHAARPLPRSGLSRRSAISG